ncbi:MAG: hypothetical protein JWO05_1734 [Gemmatimonadetes bacterium]|nr:hypothetical protein [Gemmatimonadota bacterium]
MADDRPLPVALLRALAAWLESPGEPAARVALAELPGTPGLARQLHAHRLTALHARACLAVGLPLDDEAAAFAREDAARAMQSLALLAEVAGALRDSAVAFLVLKGAPLAVRAYGDALLRRSSDVDLLVRASEIAAARRVLQALGFAPSRVRSARQDRQHVRLDGEEAWFRDADEALVELHVLATPRRFGIVLEPAMWSEPTLVRAGAVEVAVPRDGALIPYLAAHGAKHRWARAEWLLAFGRVWSTAHPDERSRALLTASDAGIVNEMTLALELWELVSQDMPAERASPRTARILDHVLSGGGVVPGVHARLALSLRLREGVAARTAFILRWIFEPGTEDWEAIPLPDALFPLYYVLRPLRLLARQVAL